MHVPTLLDGILEATARKAGAEAQITTLRATLEDEARRRLKAEGAAPSWNVPQLGKVRLDPPGDYAAHVEDADTFASFAAEHYPTEVIANITVRAADLAEALQALEFVGITATAQLETRPSWRSAYLTDLTLDVEEEFDASGQTVRTVTALDDADHVVPGIGATRKAASLVVTLDRDRRTAAITEAKAAVDSVIEAATPEDEEAAVDLAALDVRRRELEGLHADQLATIAKGHQLGSSGSKAALAERIARAEQATGHVITVATALVEARPGDADGRVIEDLPHAGDPTRPADVHTTADALALAAAADPRVAATVLPEGTEVEEVSTVPLDQPVEEVPDGGDVADVIRGDFPQVEPDSPLPTGDNAPGPGPFVDEDGAAVEAPINRLAENLDQLSREVLRQHAKAIGVSAAGAKPDVIARLVEAGVTVSAVNATAARSRA